ncbi:uncharacterized protein Dsimw501_GD24596 [Drosophila simulans]|nr:uncharacterized protein Dsimw501_GD24596 [Drosophila simulans]
MNRNRNNQIRQIDRGQEGLPQVIHMQGLPQVQLGGDQGNQFGNEQAPGNQNVRRKTTYTRTEMLSRGLPTTTQSTNRSARNCTTAVRDWSSQLSPRHRYTQPSKSGIPVSPLLPSAQATNKNIINASRQRSFLPRVAKLPNRADKSPGMNQYREARTTEVTMEQSQLPLGNHKATRHLMNTPHDSESSILVAGTGDKLISDSFSSMEHDKIKLAKAIRLPDDGNKSFVYVCKPVKKVKALLTARKLRASCEHLNGLKEGEFCLQDQETFKLQRTISEEALCSRGAGVGYTLSPVEGPGQSTSTTSSQLDSPTLAAMLQRQQQFDSKTACSQDRLRMQLEEVCHRHNHQRQLEKDQYEKEQHQLEMDQVSKKLPVLQHEIHMLHQVSEKLEATLRASNIPKPRSTVIIADISRQSSGRFYTPRTSPIQLDELPIRKLGCVRVVHIPAIEMRARIMGSVCHLGLVQEFRIETKTLNELKTADESQCFYLPAPKEEPPVVKLNEDDPLQCTSFRQLRENPNMLLKQLRQVPGTGRSFNLLDQDTMFFNSLAYADSKALGASTAEQLEVATRETGGGGAAMAHYGGALAYSRLSVRVNEVGAAVAAALQSEEQGDRPTECPGQVNNHTQTDVELPRLEKMLEPESDISSPDFTPNPSPRSMKRMKLVEAKDEVREQDAMEPNLNPRPKKTRKVIHRRAPDPPVRCDLEPKVRLKLFKTVLVGMVQIAVILVLIMAIGSPDIIC